MISFEGRKELNALDVIVH